MITNSIEAPLLRLVTSFLMLTCGLTGTYGQSPLKREHLLLDSGWKFALGHSYNKDLDFGNGKGFFSYYAKTGYGDGAAAEKFDDRAWRTVDLPHDWANELPFSRKGSRSHGYKATGDNFPENNIGWYRKTFNIPESDSGKRIAMEFEGVRRDARIWVNGFYVAEEHSAYSDYTYDISAYLNYGGINVVAVRADAGMEEGWFYEGAGIYRHVWLNKTAPIHIAYNGTFFSTAMQVEAAVITARTTVVNDGTQAQSFTIAQDISQAQAKVAGNLSAVYILQPGETKEYMTTLVIDHPKLWNLQSPNLYKAKTSLLVAGQETDTYRSSFGIRTMRFNADSGFFLNGKHVFLKGTNNHLDFSGLGVAVPDGMQAYRIQVLKSMGSNAVRCSHNPPNIAFLNACDSLGMLVIDENRLMGTSPEHYQQLSRMMLRDRNHPSIIAWSLGNEEWAIEGRAKGAAITAEMEAFAHRLDSTRRFTAAVSGGRREGISTAIDVMGYNYNEFGDIDDHHKKFPNQPMMLTEERTAFATRGIYVTDSTSAHMVPTDWNSQSKMSVAQGMQFCSTRPFMAGIFYWTGFEYHGEPDPFSWPQVISQFGIVDLCGFPKDQYYFLKAAWTDTAMVHIGTHWNWPGREDKPVYTKIYSNCDEVELFLNGKSQGRKPVPYLSFADWNIPYRSGTLIAKGYRNGKAAATDRVETAGAVNTITMKQRVYKSTITGKRSAVVNIQMQDKNNRKAPLADNKLYFEIAGHAKIIGVGNGDPSSRDPEEFIGETRELKLENQQMAFVTAESQAITNAASLIWTDFHQTRIVNKPASDTLIAIRYHFNLPAISITDNYTFFAKNMASHQSVYLNGKLLGKNTGANDALNTYPIDHSWLNAGSNELKIIGQPFVRRRAWDDINTNPGILQEISPVTSWWRKAFNGQAQVLIELEDNNGPISLKVLSDGIEPSVIALSE